MIKFTDFKTIDNVTFYTGLNYYDPSINQIISLVSSSVSTFCFNPSGDVFYVTGNSLLDMQGNVITGAALFDSIYFM